MTYTVTDEHNPRAKMCPNMSNESSSFIMTGINIIERPTVPRTQKFHLLPSSFNW
eukprot:UN04386